MIVFLINTVASIGNIFGAINLENIKVPECFIIEDELQESFDIPVFTRISMGLLSFYLQLECRTCHVPYEVRSVECESLAPWACVWLGGIALGIVQLNAWSVECRVQSEDRKLSMGFRRFQHLFSVCFVPTYSCIDLNNVFGIFGYVDSIRFFRKHLENV